MPDLFNAEKMREFQLSFGKYLRDPHTETLPEGIPPRRAQVYEHLLINNISGFINTCFPVCRRLLETAQWQQLSRAFFRDWRSQTPFFSDIPGEFLQYLQQSELLRELPPWFLSLAHYEWAELFVDICPDDGEVVAQGGLIRVRAPVLNLAYAWPVHRISSEFQPEQGEDTFLLVLRTRQHKVRFIEINAATSALIDLARQQPQSRDELIGRLAVLLQWDCDQAFTGHADQMIDDLSAWEIFEETGV